MIAVHSRTRRLQERPIVGEHVPRAVGLLELADLPRLERLRSRLIDERPTVCVHRARLLTEYFRKHGYDGRRPVLRQAQALAHLLHRLPTAMFDDELIVGSTTSHRLGCLLFPEFLALALWPELPTLSLRSFDPVALSQADADLLADEVFPYWSDKTVHEYARKAGNNPRSLALTDRLVFYVLSKANCISHVIPDYATLVERGLQSMIEEAEQQQRQTDDDEASEFYEATQVSMRAVLRLAERYAQACESAAERCNPKRAAELHESAAVLRRVPAHPARTLREALQSVWIVQVALHQENNDQALSLGRLDQILNPYYQADLAAGRLDRESAVELMGCFFIKLGDHKPLVPTDVQDLFGGTCSEQAVTIGGLSPDGGEGENDLTFVMLEAAGILAMREPNLCARLHAQSSAEYRRALSETIYRTGAAPALYSDEAAIESLTSQGIELEHARDYAIIGCVEPSSGGRTMGMTGAILFNLAAVLELALNDGVHPLSGRRVGPATGRLADFSSIEDLRAAFAEQLDQMVGLATDGNARLAAAHAAVHPTPLLSSLIDGTAESGRDVTRGGARYNSSGVAIIGLADVTDSLCALDTLVFRERRLSATNVAEALAANFCGHEKTRILLARKAPKYGTDCEQADRMAAEVVTLVAESFAERRAPRGGHYNVGYWSMTMHAGLGAATGSLPNGRPRGEPLASGATPVSGVARKGPTASLASTARLPARLMVNGIANNHKLSRRLLGGQGMLDILSRLVEVYFARGGMQVQFTVHDRETLLAAQKHPEAHRDLLVRVSGYSAYFCDLNKRMQDEIIGRTEDQF